MQHIIIEKKIDIKYFQKAIHKSKSLTMDKSYVAYFIFFMYV